MNISKNHLYYWLAYAAFFLVFGYISQGPNFSIVGELWVLFIDVFIFYAFLFGLVNFKRRPLVKFAKSVGVFALSLGFVFLFNYIRELWAGAYGVRLYVAKAAYVWECLYLYMQFAFYATGYYYLNRYGAQQQALKEQKATELATTQSALGKAELTAHKAELQQSMLALENNFLRAQINPHFLYNTFNLFYAQALPSNKDLANGLLTLADIMRYSLETIQAGQLVPLQMEVEHLRRVIGIHQLRFGNRLGIQFEAEGSFGEIKVAPLIFITLLEHALKNGDLDSPDEQIVLRLTIDDQYIYFTIRNKKSEDYKAQDHGVAFDSVKKRLQAVYGEHYKFEVHEKGGYCQVEMRVAYHNKGE
jgi:two-component system, LytTR family, sensor kinase